MKLQPGYYKIRKRDYQADLLKKHDRKNANPVRLLRVVGIGDKQKLFIDQDTIGRLTIEFPDLAEYEVVSKYEREPQIGNVHFIISFADASGERFNFMVKDAWSLRAVFDANPWLKEPFNYKPEKRKTK